VRAAPTARIRLLPRSSARDHDAFAAMKSEQAEFRNLERPCGRSWFGNSGREGDDVA